MNLRMVVEEETPYVSVDDLRDLIARDCEVLKYTLKNICHTSVQEANLKGSIIALEAVNRQLIELLDC